MLLIVGIGSDEQQTKETSAPSMDGLVWILFADNYLRSSHNCKPRLQSNPSLDVPWVRGTGGQSRVHTHTLSTLDKSEGSFVCLRL